MANNSILAHEHLQFFNGYGGFSQDGQEYHILNSPSHIPPMPWINVIANPFFGFQISESGAGFNWATNSRENKLTPWSNDPVQDPVTEAIYLLDKETKQVLTPASYGNFANGPYRCAHGFGYTRFEHKQQELTLTSRVFVCKKDPVKLWLITLENHTSKAKTYQVDYYVEWTLGVDRYQANPTITTGYDETFEYLYGQNVYAHAYQKNPAFIFASQPILGYEGDKIAYLGLQGSIQQPQGLQRPLQQQVGSFDENAGVIRFEIEVQAHSKTTFVCGLGQHQAHQQIQQYITHYRQVENAKAALNEVIQDWKQQLQQVQVETQNPAFDILINGWLLYQTLACRMLARAAFYQCGGAYGYRDQLQDSMALAHSAPKLMRQQLLLAASRQFEEGDVQHWWHPPTGVGVRTKMTDDLLWLPYVLAYYLKVTGDETILQEVVPYIKAPILEAHQHEVMYTPDVSSIQDTLYQHAKKAILKTKFGAHGLPLMGGGDWNDGMNLVGIEGHGESVWLGWFFYRVMADFLVIAQTQGDAAFSNYLQEQLPLLQQNLEKHAWDGKWYLRAYYDDGTKMGSKDCEECQIDSISQSWSILSQAGNKERTQKAFQSAWKHLVLKKEKMSLLLTPPFNQTKHNPGYIKNYYPGIRENGGQYTHASVWLAMAAVELQDYQRASILFENLLPIHHSMTKEAANHYEKEPYVLAGDISYQAPYTGRGGWSWYTGSSGWLYQGLLQTFFGIYKEQDELIIRPGTPKEWGSYTIHYRYIDTMYVISIIPKQNKDEKTKLMVDDQVIKGNRLKLINDHIKHHVIYQR